MLKKKVLPFAVLSTVLVGSLVGTVANPSVQANEAAENNNPEIKNVIFLIGDGMGVSYTSAYRYLKDDLTTPVVEQTEFDKYLVGQQMTYPEDSKETITDSASAATAMSSGVKTFNNAIAVDNDKSNVETVLEAAKEAGKSTGLVATSEITHGANAETTLKKYIDQELLALTATEIDSVQLAGEKASDIETAIKTIFDKRSYTGWTTGGHTGEDVPVYAFGPSKERFAGLLDNTDHAKIIFDILKVANPNEDKH